MVFAYDTQYNMKLNYVPGSRICTRESADFAEQGVTTGIGAHQRVM